MVITEYTEYRLLYDEVESFGVEKMKVIAIYPKVRIRCVGCG